MNHPAGRQGSRPIIPIVPVQLMPGIEAAHKVQPRSVKGRFTRLRWVMVWLTQLFFIGMPWLQMNGRQAVRFDLEGKRFYLLDLVLYPHDLILLTGLLILSALTLFVVTAVAGRIWCGFACPQTVYTEMFLWIEHQFEGERHHRLRLDQSPWNLHKVLRRGGKHLGWIGLSLITGMSFVGWFSPVRDLASQTLSLSMGPWDLFWILFYALATYGNAGYLREKVCQHMCPYGRFQGALMDVDTRVVSYDTRRGEPRASLRTDKASARAQGACVDCTLCVQVCPVGIDIRAGAQSLCIGCGVCIDACDTVMDKLQAPLGLIRMASQRELKPETVTTTSASANWRRVHLYVAMLLIVSGAMAWTVIQRPDLHVNVIRDRGVMARMVDEGAVENVYRLQVMNQTESQQRIAVSVEGLPGAEVISQDDGGMAPAQDRMMVISVRLPAQAANAMSGQVLPIHLRIASRSDQSTDAITEASTFVVPR